MVGRKKQSRCGIHLMSTSMQIHSPDVGSIRRHLLTATVSDMYTATPPPSLRRSFLIGGKNPSRSIWSSGIELSSQVSLIPNISREVILHIRLIRSNFVSGFRVVAVKLRTFRAPIERDYKIGPGFDSTSPERKR